MKFPVLIWSPQMPTSFNVQCASNSFTRTQCRDTWKTNIVEHLLLNVTTAQRFAKISQAWRNIWGQVIRYTSLSVKDNVCCRIDISRHVLLSRQFGGWKIISNQIVFKHYLFILEANKTQCSVCMKFIHRNTISRHMKNLHGDSPRVECQHCEKICKNLTSYKDHLRRDHCIYQSNWLK